MDFLGDNPAPAPYNVVVHDSCSLRVVGGAITDDRERLGVLVVDDSEDFLAVACSWSESQPALSLLGTVRNGAEAPSRFRLLAAGIRAAIHDVRFDGRPKLGNVGSLSEGGSV